MNKAIEKIVGIGGAVYAKFNSLSQAELARSKAPKVITPGMPEILRDAAAQGAVLLENNGVLPLSKGSRVALFGRVQNDWFYTGYGSGGDVNKPYAVSLTEGVRNCDELELNENLAKVAFTNDEKTVLVVVNNSGDEQEISFLEKYPGVEIFVTDKDHNCEKVADKISGADYTLSARSITTFVFDKTIK